MKIGEYGDARAGKPLGPSTELQSSPFKDQPVGFDERAVHQQSCACPHARCEPSFPVHSSLSNCIRAMSTYRIPSSTFTAAVIRFAGGIK